MEKPAVALSVVIPCRDAAQHLGEALAALSREQLDVSWEVIVADNGSKDATRALARRYQDVLPLRVVDASARRGPWYARNAGAAAAKGNDLVFLDSDDVIAPGYLARMGEALAGSDLVAAVLEGERLNPGWLARSRPLGLVDGLNHHLDFLPFATGACLGVRRRAFEVLGGFAELQTGEDIDLCWRAQLQGMTLRVAPGAVLHYRFRHSLPSLLRQAVGYGRSQPRLYRSYRTAGMPKRGVRRAVGEWRAIARRLVKARSRDEVAEGLYLGGIAMGRAVGSVEQRVLYL